MGHAQLLERDPTLPEHLRSQARTIHESSEALLFLLNSILELSRIEAGHLFLKPAVFSPRHLFQELAALFRERAQSKQLRLVVSLAKEVPASVEADRDKLRQAVVNLLSNAIKFTHQGEVHLGLSLAQPARGDLRLVVEVRDTGPGIPATELKDLFQRYRQTSAGRAARVGSGLGLHLSQGYARLMGGELTARSEPGVGSVFRLEVPVTRAAARGPLPRPQEFTVLRCAPGAPEYRVLVVDDLADNRELLRLLLTWAGFTVQLAANGWEALRIVQAWQPQLILVDARMPEMDGFETIRRIRAQPQGPQPRLNSLRTAIDAVFSQLGHHRS